MPGRNKTGPFGTFRDCVDPETGLRRPFGLRLGRGRRNGRRGR